MNQLNLFHYVTSTNDNSTPLWQYSNELEEVKNRIKYYDETLSKKDAIRLIEDIQFMADHEHDECHNSDELNDARGDGACDERKEIGKKLECILEENLSPAKMRKAVENLIKTLL